MEGVLISIQRPHTDNIKALLKTIEVRKNKPKLKFPFPCFIYETKGKGGCGKVIGEFVCDKVEAFYCASVPYKKENNLGYGHFLDNGVYKVNGWHEGVVFERNDMYIDTMLKNKELEEMCLSAQNIFDYIGIGKYLYGWHISELKIYDEPKELSEFCAQGGCDYERCRTCKWLSLYRVNGFDCEEDCDAPFDNEEYHPITRPPQSWCYVEEV